MEQNTAWKLDTPADAVVRVDEDVVALRSPLVRVHRNDTGAWHFRGPYEASGPGLSVTLGAVVTAWPHVIGLGPLTAGSGALWSWDVHGWISADACACGSCEPPKPVDLDGRCWPANLDSEALVDVENNALSGQVTLSVIVSLAERIELLGPGNGRRTPDELTPVSMAHVVRRWPHTMYALQRLKPGYGLRWNGASLSWSEYQVAAAA